MAGDQFGGRVSWTEARLGPLVRLARECVGPVACRSVSMELTAVLTPAEEGGFVALNPETGTTTQGETIEEAVANLQEATELFLAEFPLAPGSRGHAGVTTFTVPAHA